MTSQTLQSLGWLWRPIEGLGLTRGSRILDSKLNLKFLSFFIFIVLETIENLDDWLYLAMLMHEPNLTVDNAGIDGIHPWS